MDNLIQNNFVSNSFLNTPRSKSELLATFLLAIVYLGAVLLFFPVSNVYLFYVLAFTEVFHFWQCATYVYSVWDMEYLPTIQAAAAESGHLFRPGVDVFITVAGEPVDIVEQTARACLDMIYPDYKVYILNDGYVAGKDNWAEIQELASSLGIGCITRKVPGGAKAGNINNALRVTEKYGTANPYVAIFDADHVPHPDFLEKTMPYFADPKMGFVQTPQYYKNHSVNYVTSGAWQQQEIFFGAISKGKNRLNAVFMCGTNMVISRQALMQAGGMAENNIAEDFFTSQFIHANGWKSIYVPEVLAEGLAPEDFLSYYKQQYRWARGSLDTVFRHNPLFRKGLSWPQKIQYLASSSYYLSGLVVLINAILPLIFFFTGLTPFKTPTMLLAALFLPYIFMSLYVLGLTSNFSYTYKAMAFSIGQFNIQIKAMFSAIFGTKQSFAVTSKRQLQGNFLNLVIPHLLYIALTVAGVVYAFATRGPSASVITNTAWALINCIIFGIFIAAAWPTKAEHAASRRQKQVSKNVVAAVTKS